MQSLQAQTVDRLPFATNSGIRRAPAFGRLTALFDALRLRKIAQTHVVPGYEGYGWCDSSERQLNFDLTACRRSWIF